MSVKHHTTCSTSPRGAIRGAGWMVCAIAKIVRGDYGICKMEFIILLLINAIIAANSIGNKISEISEIRIIVIVGLDWIII